MTANKLRSFLIILGYITFFVVCFIVSLVITFPYDRLTGYAEEKARAAMGMEVAIDSLRPSLFGGLRLEGVTLGPSLEPPPAGSAPTTPLVHIDRGTIGVSWLGLLFGSTDVSFDLELAGGEAEGSFEQNEEHVALTLEFNGLQANQIPVMESKVGLPIKGTLMGSVDFDVPAGHADQSVGSFQLGAQGVVIGDGRARLSLSSLMGYGERSSGDDEGTLIQPIKIGPVNFQSKIVEGVIDIPRVEATSEHAELTFEGRIKLAEPLAQSRIETYLTVKLLQAYADQDEETSSLVSLVDTVGSRAKRDDGSFGFRISGAFGTGLVPRPSKTFSLPAARGGMEPNFSNRPAGRRRPPLPARFGGDDSNNGPNLPRPSIQQPTITPPTTTPPTTTPPTTTPTTTPRPDLYPSGMPRPTPTTIPPPTEMPETQDDGYQQNGQQYQQEQYQQEDDGQGQDQELDE